MTDHHDRMSCALDEASASQAEAAATNKQELASPQRARQRANEAKVIATSQCVARSERLVDASCFSERHGFFWTRQDAF
eukprot:scaffold4097_cov306-Pinguiococcus_pyrenoidosus.AAC.28